MSTNIDGIDEGGHMEKEKSMAYLNECLKELKAMDDEEFRKRDEMAIKVVGPLSSHAVLGEVAAIKKHCRHCVYYWNHDKSMIEPCSIHPYYNRNRNNDCKDFKKKWYLFWIRN